MSQIRFDPINNDHWVRHLVGKKRVLLRGSHIVGLDLELRGFVTTTKKPPFHAVFNEEWIFSSYLHGDLIRVLWAR